MFSIAGKKPKNIGIQSGRLAECPNRPNCVSSYATNKMHGIAPFKFDGEIVAQVALLVDTLNGVEGVTIQQQDENYLHAECKTKLMGFVDDLEFYWSDNGVCHVRSAARRGWGDAGVNRRRVESIRSAFVRRAGQLNV